MPFGRQSEPARGGEIEFARIARQLADHESQVAAAHPLFEREQRIGGPGGEDVDQSPSPILGQAGAIGQSAQLRGAGILDPQYAALVRDIGQFAAMQVAPAIVRQGERQARPARLAHGGEYFGMARRLPQPGPPMCRRHRSAREELGGV